MSNISENRVISKFNFAVQELVASYNCAKEGKFDQQQERLHSSADAIYSAIEWIVDKYRDKWKKQLQRKTSYKADLKMLTNSRDPLYFYNSLDIIEKHEQLNSKQIDIRVLKENKKPLRNKPIHEGTVPFHGSLIKVLQEGRKLIFNFYPHAVLENMPDPQAFVSEQPLTPADPNWEKFLRECDGFNDEQRTYVLIIGSCQQLTQERLKLLSLLNWSLIIDIDPDTEGFGGFFSAAKSDLSQYKKIHLFTCEQIQTFSPYNAMYWLALRGITGRTSTLTTDVKTWRRNNKRHLLDIIQNFARTFSPPITTVVMDHSDYIDDICESIDLSYGGTNKFVYAIDDSTNIAPIIDHYEGELINISIPSIVAGIRSFSQSLNITADYSQNIVLPAKDSSEIDIPIDDYNFIEENFEIIHKNILQTQKIEQERIDFFKGREITWYGISRRYDADRDVTKKISKQIENSFKRRGNSLIFIPYPPGLGGTTIGKRLAWQFHDEYPTLFIKRYDPRMTVERLRKVYLLTTKPILVLIESSIVSFDNTRKLFNEVKAMTFPTVFLIIQRSFIEHKEDFIGGEISEFPMNQYLSDNECQILIDSYKELTPSNERKEKLQRIRSAGRNEEKHPFYMGLTAFEKDFLGLESYIEKSLKDSTDVQKKVAAFLALTYNYAKQGLSPQLFANLLGIPANRTVKLQEHLSERLQQILIYNKASDGKLIWQPLHQLIAKELLEQILSGNSSDKRIWKQNLSDYAIEFIELTAQGNITPTDSQIELFKRLFILKDDEELVDTRIEAPNYSSLIEDTPPEGRLPIFKKLIECFPNEAHFYAHLARYYSKEDKNINEALYYVDKAILLSPNDPILFHMKGMCLVSCVHIHTDALWENKNCEDKDIREITELVSEIGSLFERTRELANYNEYGYVSHIYLLLHIIDFGFSISRYSQKTDFLKAPESTWYRELLDLAESLTENMKRMKEGDENTGKKSLLHIQRCNAKLYELYGNFSAIIEGWNNLLDKNIYKPSVRRQIIRAYQRKVGAWDKMESRIINLTLDYMEKNIQEEPQNERNIYLWFQAARYDALMDIDTVIEKVSRWYTNTESNDSIFYLYILYVMKAIQGFSEAKYIAENFIRKSSDKNRFHGNRTVPYEWYGKKVGLQRLVNLNQLGKKEDEMHSWANVGSLLEPLNGHISNMQHSGRGEIELECGLKAFFTPAHGNFTPGQDENQKVKFYLAFSYDGLRAYNVCKV